MINKKKNEYFPDCVTHPGDTLLETINAISMSQTELAERTGRPKKTINEIIKGKTVITPDTAIQLEKVLRIPASFWNNLQRNFDEFQAREKDQANLANHIDWLKNFPVNEMIRKGWLPKSNKAIERLKTLLSFFSVASPEIWETQWKNISVSYRKSTKLKSDEYALAAWLRQGEIEASKITCIKYDKNKFSECLATIRSLTNEQPDFFCGEITARCAQSGVAVVFIPELPKTASGATRWINDKAIIQLSLKYKTNDHLWFSFFHEAAHILRHSRTEIYIEKDAYSSEMESEADHFAANLLISPDNYEQFIRDMPITQIKIESFAKSIDIAPGIVVGRLQHDKHIQYSQFNDLKIHFDRIKNCI